MVKLFQIFSAHFRPALLDQFYFVVLGDGVTFACATKAWVDATCTASSKLTFITNI